MKKLENNFIEYVAFNYYGGIRSCYKKTKYDPFYNSKIKLRYPRTKNDDWLYNVVIK